MFKVRDSHRDKTEQCVDILIAGSVYFVLNLFVGFGASGESETDGEKE